MNELHSSRPLHVLVAPEVAAGLVEWSEPVQIRVERRGNELEMFLRTVGAPQEDGAVPLTPEAIKGYLDDTITRWRLLRDADGEHSDLAPAYIDAFQSVRTSLFGEILP